MGGVVDGGIIEEDQVLIGGAAANVEARAGLAYRRDPREGDHGAEDVRFTEDGGHLFYGADVDPCYPHLERLYIGLFFGDYGSGLEAGDELFHFDVQLA